MAIPYSLWPALTSVSSLHVTDTDPALTDTEPTGAVPLIIIVPVLVSMASSLVAGAGGYALVSCARDSTARSDQPTTTASITLDLYMTISFRTVDNDETAKTFSGFIMFG